MKKQLLLGSLGAVAALGTVPVAHQIPVLAADSSTTTISVTVVNVTPTVVKLEMQEDSTTGAYITNGKTTYNPLQKVRVNYSNAKTIKYELMRGAMPSQSASRAAMEIGEIREITTSIVTQNGEEDGEPGDGVDEIEFDLREFGGAYGAYTLLVTVSNYNSVQDSITFNYASSYVPPSTEPEQPTEPEEPTTPEEPSREPGEITPENPPAPADKPVPPTNPTVPSVPVTDPEKDDVSVEIKDKDGNPVADIPVKIEGDKVIGTITDPNTGKETEVEIGKVVTDPETGETHIEITLPFDEMGLPADDYSTDVNVTDSETGETNTSSSDHTYSPIIPADEIKPNDKTGDPVVTVPVSDKATEAEIKITDEKGRPAKDDKGNDINIPVKIDQSTGKVTATVPQEVTDSETGGTKIEMVEKEIGHIEKDKNGNIKIVIDVPLSDFGLKGDKYAMSITTKDKDGNKIGTTTTQVFTYLSVPGVPNTGGNIFEAINFGNSDVSAILITIFVASVLAGGLYLKKTRKSN